jgi:septal ring factor EnvC (AmiA/AmiB activator)
VADGNVILKRLAGVRGTVKDKETKDELKSIEDALRELLKAQQDELDQLQKGLRDAEQNVAKLEQTVAAQAKEIEDLKKQVPPGQAASPLDVANAFRQVVEQVQTEARDTPGVGTTIKSLDLEVKAFVHVEDGGVTALSFPKPDAEVDSSALSTLRVSFGAIPGVAPPPEPPT